MPYAYLFAKFPGLLPLFLIIPHNHLSLYSKLISLSRFSPRVPSFEGSLSLPLAMPHNLTLQAKERQRWRFRWIRNLPKGIELISGRTKRQAPNSWNPAQHTFFFTPHHFPSALTSMALKGRWQPFAHKDCTRSDSRPFLASLFLIFVRHLVQGL